MNEYKHFFTTVPYFEPPKYNVQLKLTTFSMSALRVIIGGGEKIPPTKKNLN